MTYGINGSNDDFEQHGQKGARALDFLGALVNPPYGLLNLKAATQDLQYNHEI